MQLNDCFYNILENEAAKIVAGSNLYIIDNVPANTHIFKMETNCLTVTPINLITFYKAYLVSPPHLPSSMGDNMRM